MSEKFEKLKSAEEASVCHTYGRYPLAVARAKGCRLWDLDGKEYVDLLAGIAVVGLGHSRPELLTVINEQYEKLVQVSNLFYQEEQVALAEKLLATCEAGRVFFCNSGAEANEAAIKLARRYMRKVKGRDVSEIVSLLDSFHGRTMGALAATGQPKLQDGFEPLAGGFAHIPFGDVCALRAAVSERTCAVMVEMVQGESGIKPQPREWVDALLALRQEHGFLIIVDEVQAGLCRTGKFWSHQHYGFVPDIFTVSKSLANGLPMGAMLATEEVATGFVPGSHATTFGGGALISAVASKVIDIMVEEDLPGRVAEMGEFCLAEFRKLLAKHPDKIAHVRGVGLMLAIELANPGQDVHRALLDAGFVLNLAHGTILRLLPPLVIEKADILAFVKALDGILKG
jgi:acetylornithine aminotransferase